VSRWDRPPGPKDVRWFLRLVGKILIVTGLLMFGFVAYQLWGTGIEYARAQDRAEDHFNETLERLSTTTSTTTSTTSSTTSTTTLPPGVTTVAGSVVATTVSTTSTTTSSTTPPVTTIPDFAEIIAGMEITEGSAFGFIGFPKLDQGMYIFPGVSREDLKNGPGHFPETPMPGQLGNSAIAGHRTTYGEPFRHLDELEVGDEIVVTMPYGIFTYRVTSVEIVDPSDREVIATTDPDVASLTLTTCHPEYSASQRLIIHADLDLEASPPPGLPVINYGRDTPIPTDVGLPGEDVDDPTTTLAPTTTTSVSPTSTIAGQTTGPSTSAVATSLAPTTVVAPSTTTDPLYTVNPGGGATGGPTDVLDNAEEAFSNRWFSDEEAFPQVTLWAGSCAAIVMAAYLLAERFRNLLIGIAIGVLPFVVGLYFFYENVNRLLPAAL
jgi:sortase A